MTNGTLRETDFKKVLKQLSSIGYPINPIYKKGVINGIKLGTPKRNSKSPIKKSKSPTKTISESMFIDQRLKLQKNQAKIESKIRNHNKKNQEYKTQITTLQMKRGKLLNSRSNLEKKRIQ